jgi:hypothetical protein
MKEWTYTLPSGLPFWELESLRSPKFLNNNFRGQNSLDWKVHHTIGNLLKCICLKWACMTHLSSYNTSYGQNKGQESKCQFDCRPLKVKNHLEICACKWHATYRYKALYKGYNLYLNLTSIGGIYKKIQAFKVLESQFRKKWHLDPTLVVNHRKYYKEDGGGFPQVWVVMSLVSLCMPMVRLCTKSASIMP